MACALVVLVFRDELILDGCGVEPPGVAVLRVVTGSGIIGDRGQSNSNGYAAR